MSNAKPAIAASEIPPEWPGIIREIVQREGVAICAGLDNTLQSQVINTGAFSKIMLPGGGFSFATAEDRDAVLAEIQRG